MAAVQPKPKIIGDSASLLLAHYADNARILPWRHGPGPERGAARPDPYHVWLSEIMLQQTTVAAVIPYFAKFTQAWPDFAALAAADENDVMAAWAGLGYYARARNLIACARGVVSEHGGQLPDDEAALLKLPGIGRYTAAAIAAIAFGKRAIVVDANIERVVARLFAITTPLPAAKVEIYAAMDAITPAENAGDFAQAMMDLGASICSVKAPRCPDCPLLSHCVAGQAGNAESLPIKPAKRAKPHRRGMAWWIECDGAVWLVRRPGKGMLAGMRALPDNGWSAAGDGDGTPPIDAEWHSLPVHVDHIFTHFSLSLSLSFTAVGADVEPSGEGQWWPVKSLDKAGLPTLFSKAAQAVLASRGRD